VRKDGSLYHELHRIKRLSDGGPDHPTLLIALCPTCHPGVHVMPTERPKNTFSPAPVIEPKE
jgi:5-methylcytosine-specific restriction protein A